MKTLESSKFVQIAANKFGMFALDVEGDVWIMKFGEGVWQTAKMKKLAGGDPVLPATSPEKDNTAQN